MLHDVGKIALSNLMLSKPDPLTDEEWDEMRRHPEIGARILANAQLGDIGAGCWPITSAPTARAFRSASRTATIPLEARILAVADAYEAMTSERPYRPAMTSKRHARSCAATPARSSTRGWSRRSCGRWRKSAVQA